MATLIDAYKILLDSQGDPAAGDPAVQAAIDLRRRIEMALLVRAADYMSGNLPPAANEDPGAQNELLGWAQDVIANSWAHADRTMRLLIAANVQSTVAQILGVTDQALLQLIGVVVRQMARGRHPGV